MKISSNCLTKPTHQINGRFAWWVEGAVASITTTPADRGLYRIRVLLAMQARFSSHRTRLYTFSGLFYRMYSVLVIFNVLGLRRAYLDASLPLE